jgi:hypothetical protein
MKKTILSIAIGLIAMTAYSQSTNADTSLKIVKEVDVMEGKTYYYPNNKLLVSEDGKKGFLAYLSLSKDGEGFKYSGIVIKAAQIGSCHEKSYLTVLFDDDTKIKLMMWNDFNCEGKIYLDLYSKQLSELNKPIKTIRLTNGRTYDEFTMNITGKDKYYFMDCISLINSQSFVEKK